MPRANRGAYLVFVRKRGQFYIQWYEHGAKRQRSTGTADRQAAETALAEFIVGRARAEQPAGPRDPRHFPISEALALYAEEHAPTTAAPARIAYAIEALVPWWGDNPVSAITQETCRAYSRDRRRSDGTVRKELGVLRAALNFAQRYGRLTAVPHVFLPSKPEGKHRWLTRSEGAALLRAAIRSREDTRLYLPLFIVLALYTGARKDALLSLRWPQIDFERRLIDLNPPGRRRTNKRRAVLPIPDRLMTFLRLARRRGTDLGYVVHRDGKRIRDIGGAWNGETAPEGKRQYAQGAFGRACFRAGLVGVSPHTLRHTCGTWMAQRGVDLWQIAGWLGQTHARTTELYAHHSPDFLAAARRAADRRA